MQTLFSTWNRRLCNIQMFTKTFLRVRCKVQVKILLFIIITHLERITEKILHVIIITHLERITADLTFFKRE